MIQKRMKIGELAKETGLTAKTIRFYEGIQLLDDPGRTESGYRQYGAEDVERLHRPPLWSGNRSKPKSRECL